MTYETLIPRFLKYVKVETRSDETSTTVPSTQSQVEFAKQLADELTTIGLSHVHINAQTGYVMATLPANVETEAPAVGFIAHIDTADFNAENVKPQIVPNYDGQSVIKLDKEGTYLLDPAVFPSLKKYAGQTLITTDGTTLLGADDKAGVAEIVTAMAYLIEHPEIKHGTVQIGLGPDEEIGIGADHFDVADFGAAFAYTVDGGPLGQLEYETFNAADAQLQVKGTNVHPGDAKDVMVNALQVAIDFHNELPAHDRPEKTAGREGFFHLYQLTGTVDAASMGYIIRDHDRQKFEAKKQLMQTIVQQLNTTYGAGTVTLKLKDQYYNMREVIERDMGVVTLAKEAMEALDIKPDIAPVRGGTDGSKISFLGLPTPNLFAGGENMHGRYEYVSTETMAKATDVILKIIELTLAQS
ncbi:peptidase T [Secundilactobacillus kimchicus]|uniref:peptidase T n=1 Tax=Secundilactobacillus kimchicus TaxID=528209 RepID=UPI001C034E63|nr:peptidase T [Secundilactobacillus kimchicus]MBT9672938.1 peptidase T [Secundilactobacillus kimchicus]